MRQRIPSAGHRHREDRADTAQPPVPRQPLLVFTMTPHTTRLLVLTHSDAADPIPSAALHRFKARRSCVWRLRWSFSLRRRISAVCPLAFSVAGENSHLGL